MADFIMMCGLQGSGKSTFAYKLSDEMDGDNQIVSSDRTRVRLFDNVNFQGDNTTVFNEMKKETEFYLMRGCNVIYDATNLSRKRRMALIKNMRYVDRKIVYYIATSIEKCIDNDFKRHRTVGEEVIRKAYKRLQIPIESEGWDEVRYCYNTDDVDLNDSYVSIYARTINKIIEECVDYDFFENELSKMSYTFSNIKGLSQDSKYHHFSVSRHTYHVFDYIKNLEIDKDRKHNLLIAAMFHDVGKYACKSFTNHKGESTRYANFIGHENVSAQLADLELRRLRMSPSMIIDIVTLIQFHMDLNQQGDKVMSRLEKLLRPEQIEDLLLLHEADLSAK